eukprot:COSAG02_NODE_20642_length_821_cov_1.250693_1_plen_37_part_01
MILSDKQATAAAGERFAGLSALKMQKNGHSARDDARS